MPTYRYECKKCGNTFDKFQSMTDAPVKKCPECKGTVKRLISSGAGLIFKGSGFYKTDYASPSAKPEKKDKKSDKKAPCGNPDGCGGCGA